MSKNVIVVSISKALTDLEIGDELSKPYDEGFTLLCVVDSRDDKLRAVFKRGSTYVDPARRAVEESEARSIVAAHPELSLPQAVGLLAANGIKRNSGWVSAERSRTVFSSTK